MPSTSHHIGGMALFPNANCRKHNKLSSRYDTPPLQLGGPQPAIRKTHVSSDDEAAFLKAFRSTGLVQEALANRKLARLGVGRRGSFQGGDRLPTSVAAVERRWFVGRQTVLKAQLKTAAITPTLLGIGTGGPPDDLELVGTAALVAMADDLTKGIVRLCPSPHPGLWQVHIAIKSRRRGRPKKVVGGAAPEAARDRVYLLHETIVAACRRYVAARNLLDVIEDEQDSEDSGEERGTSGSEDEAKPRLSRTGTEIGGFVAETEDTLSAADTLAGLLAIGGTTMVAREFEFNEL